MVSVNPIFFICKLKFKECPCLLERRKKVCVIVTKNKNTMIKIHGHYSFAEKKTMIRCERRYKKFHQR